MDEETGPLVPLERSPAETPVGDEVALRPSDQLAAEVAKVLDLIASRMALESPHPSTARRVRGARTVPREFVLSLIAMAERRPGLPAFSTFDSAAARAVLEDADAYRLIAERTAMFLASVNYTIEARWAATVAEAMRTLAIATGVARDPEEADLAAELETLRRHLGRKGKRKKKTAKVEEKPE